ncbi:DUF5667 domain-containing protein [Longispora fulva]|uniref:DUF5667 domain-containing protein n=1 Tax=Longispora fulva TaxID=619741 RepID=A0A8J7KSS4_9ACTN|nr:DUF5667 domain-containing protein [Longispora fulva]MBG6139947.1 hypothetical protein [Longispora fulva]
MNAFLLKRRQTERFAQLLDEQGGGPRHHVRTEYDPDLSGMFPVVDRLTGLGHAVDSAPAPDFKRDLHAMLMATIERDGIGVTAADQTVEEAPRASRGRRVRIAAIAGLAAGTLAVSSMSMASGDANPGDALYGMKRSTEKAQLALAGTDISRGQLYLQFARTRMDEALTIAGDPDALGSVLNDMDNETRQGVRLLTSGAVDRKDATALDAVDAFVAVQRRGMADLLSRTEGDRGRAVTSLTLLDEVATRSASLRGVLNCMTSTGSVLDDLGPIPQKCGPTGGRPTESTPTPGRPTHGAGSSQPGTKAPVVVVPTVVPSMLPGGGNGPLDKLPIVGNSATPTPSASAAPANGGGGGLLDTVGKILGGIFG